MRVLNLYAGVGGNRKLWTDCDVTAVELDPKISEVYSKLYPNDTIIIGDAHQYLIDHASEYDFIWSSPPCQPHSKMVKFTRHKFNRYIDLSLYQEILYLQHSFKGKWVVENVIPFYEPLIPAQKVGRHLYWSNFDVGDYIESTPPNFINLDNLRGKQNLMDWLGIHFSEKLYYNGNHCPAQVLRNCVHPNEGLSIFNNMKRSLDGKC